MILERQPPHPKLIETAFRKCEAEVAKKKVEAVKSLTNGGDESAHDLKLSYTGASLSVNRDNLSADWRLSKQSNVKKRPPEPPDPSKYHNSNPVQSAVSVVEHPLAITNKHTSQLMSTLTKTISSVPNPRCKEKAKVTKRPALRNRSDKDKLRSNGSRQSLERDIELRTLSITF